jgi:hypothetical protein
MSKERIQHVTELVMEEDLGVMSAFKRCSPKRLRDFSQGQLGEGVEKGGMQSLRQRRREYRSLGIPLKG